MSRGGREGGRLRRQWCVGKGRRSCSRRRARRRSDSSLRMRHTETSPWACSFFAAAAAAASFSSYSASSGSGGPPRVFALDAHKCPA